MEKKHISAQIIADSISPSGKRITTFVLIFPRIILSELNTHRAFSRSSASSRAIPARRVQEMIALDRFNPLKWMKEHTGMQGTKYFDGTCSQEFGTLDPCFNGPAFKDVPATDHLEDLWREAAGDALRHSQKMTAHGVTKQISNRLLEPFMWHTALVTATDFGNFFSLRAHEAAEIHLQELAFKMLAAYNDSMPKALDFGHWHIPFGHAFDGQKLNQVASELSVGRMTFEDAILQAKLMIATARCARVSYMNFEGKDDYAADIELFYKLREMGHWSPFEHCAQAVLQMTKGNFDGWKQFRADQPNENRTDGRILTKTYAEAKYYWENKTD